MRRSDFADLIVVAVIVGVALYILGAHVVKSEDALATMVGALLGAAALFLGNWISRWNDRRRAIADLAEHVAKVKALVTAELVNVAAGLIGALDYMNAAITTADAGGLLPAHDDLTRHSPRRMRYTESLGAELLILPQRAIDVLATLSSNLSITQITMEEVTTSVRPFGPLIAAQIAAGIRQDMGVLAEAFDEFAPTRRLTLLGAAPEQATVILRRLARG